MAAFTFRNHRNAFLKIAPILTGLLLTLAANGPVRAQGGHWSTLPGHVPGAEWHSLSLGHLASSQQMNLAIALPLRNPAGLNDLINRIYDPSDPMYGHYLTPAQFTAQFGPSLADYTAVMKYCESHGLAVTGAQPNRLILDVHGTAAAVESAFAVQLGNFVGQDGRVFFAPFADPAVPSDIAGKISAIVGLDSALVLKTHVSAVTPQAAAMMGASPMGTGVGGALGPSDIRSVYSLTDVPETGTGQSIGLFELSGYSSADIVNYEQTYNLPAVPITNVSVDSASTGPAGGGGQFETTMDIELQMALAPAVSHLMVYIGPNNGNGIIDTYSRIASDNIAKSVSTSWGAAEYKGGAAFYNAENTIFQEMAAQGQSMFAASGDSGAYDNGSSLSVDDPAAQPFVTGCGGTTLTTGQGGIWSSETTWNNPSDKSRSSFGAGGGGGVSIIWSQPNWQSGVGASATMRNVPDVVLDADPFSGYSTVVSGQWYYGGGTSAAAPLWAAFTALVNERRVGNGGSYLGLANPSLYATAKSALYSGAFHDIADNSTNLFYSATAGFDNASGWGSFIGDGLMSALASSSSVAVVPPAKPTGLVAVSGDTQVTLNWTATNGAATYNVRRASSAFSAFLVVATGVSGPTYTDTGLTNGHIYYYEVQAANTAGNSAYTKAVSCKPMPPIPGAPTGLAATPGNAMVALSWSPVPEATSYRVQRALVAGGPFATIATIAGTSLNNIRLVNYHTYYYQICAVNMSGVGQPCTPVSAMPVLPIPNAPTNLKATLSGKRVYLRWTPATYAASYNIERSQTSGGPYTVIKSGDKTLPFIDATGVAGAQYFYVVVATNPSGSSGTSNEATATIPGAASIITTNTPPPSNNPWSGWSGR
ncbi:MAG TPA: protease pro-enzyme activation domain-containing protein [Capsulimonadaceae bacterium]|nr:protease pro-enzyme activation domain-containing protein [Capsulimonadaceae bacterium]